MSRSDRSCIYLGDEGTSTALDYPLLNGIAIIGARKAQKRPNNNSAGRKMQIRIV